LHHIVRGGTTVHGGWNIPGLLRRMIIIKDLALYILSGKNNQGGSLGFEEKEKIMKM